MSLVDELKAKLKPSRKVDSLADSIRKNPEYAKVLAKLEDFYVKREELFKDLRRVELEIDACLLLIEMRREKEEIEKE